MKNEAKNIVYKSTQIQSYFSKNRVSLLDFYKSEREVIDGLNLDESITVLDIGCGCGGLGVALRERYGITDYLGVEINELAASAGIALNPLAKILCGDFLECIDNKLNNKYFDIVFSLSCFDWNVQFSEMLEAAWQHVVPGGSLVATFRITLEGGCDDIATSYQYLNYEGLREGEKAAYVVMNVNDLFDKLKTLNPSKISAKGYFRSPSPTAVTPYSQLCMTALAIRKRKHSEIKAIVYDLDIPTRLLTNLHLDKKML